MGKVYNKRSALGNHQRQRAQATMMLHGWVAFGARVSSTLAGAGAYNASSKSMIRKDAATGKASIFLGNATAITLDEIEWDEVSTPRVLWLYKVMLREKML
jgi:hypothetical protein